MEYIFSIIAAFQTGCQSRHLHSLTDAAENIMFYVHLQCVYANVTSPEYGHVVLSGTAIHCALK